MGRSADFRDLPPADGLSCWGGTDEQLPASTGRVAVVYPSCYEGFGLPVLEAMQWSVCDHVD